MHLNEGKERDLLSREGEGEGRGCMKEKLGNFLKNTKLRRYFRYVYTGVK